MALQTDIKIEDFNLNLKDAYIRLSEFTWKSGYHADVVLDVWVDKQAAVSGRQPIKRLNYQMPLPLSELDNDVTKSYNQVRSLVYNWVKTVYLKDSINI